MLCTCHNTAHTVYMISAVYTLLAHYDFLVATKSNLGHVPVFLHRCESSLTEMQVTGTFNLLYLLSSSTQTGDTYQVQLQLMQAVKNRKARVH